MPEGRCDIGKDGQNKDGTCYEPNAWSVGEEDLRKGGSRKVLSDT